METLGAAFGQTAALGPLVFAASAFRPLFVRSPAVQPITIVSPDDRSTSVGSFWYRPTGRETASATERQVIQHIVLFTPKPELTAFDLWSFAQEVVRVLANSTDVSRASLGRRKVIDAGYQRSFGDKTYEYAAVIEFNDETALVRYLNCPEHAELGRLFWDTCGETVVSDVDGIDVRSHDAARRVADLV